MRTLRKIKYLFKETKLFNMFVVGRINRKKESILRWAAEVIRRHPLDKNFNAESKIFNYTLFFLKYATLLYF